MYINLSLGSLGRLNAPIYPIVDSRNSLTVNDLARTLDENRCTETKWGNGRKEDDLFRWIAAQCTYQVD